MKAVGSTTNDLRNPFIAPSKTDSTDAKTENALIYQTYAMEKIIVRMVLTKKTAGESDTESDSEEVKKSTKGE